MHQFKRVLALLIALVMTLSMLPLSVIAEEVAEEVVEEAIPEEAPEEYSEPEASEPEVSGEDVQAEISEYTEIALGESVLVTEFPKYFKFVPEADGSYIFESSEYYNDPYAYLYDSNFNELCYDDDSGDSWNFIITYNLTAGETYYFQCGTYNSDSESYYVTVIEDPVESIEVTGQIEIVENTNGYWDTRYNEEIGEYEDFYFYSNFDTSPITVILTLKDGTVEKHSLYSLDADWDFYVQYDEPWVLGGTYHVDATGMGYSFQIPVTIVEDPVDYIELANGTEKQYTENLNGYISERYNEETGEYEEFFRYNTSYPYDAQIRIVYKDGSSVIANVGNDVDGYYVGWSDNQYNQPWFLGSDNVSYITYMDRKVVLPITVIEDPVESIEIIGQVEIIENTEGYWETYYIDETNVEEFYYYSYFDFDNITVRFNYKDGTSEDYYCYEVINGYSDDQYDNHWLVGGTYYVSSDAMGYSIEIPVTIIENPVESIEVIGQIEFVEHTGGYWDGRYNEETGEEEEFYYYDSFSFDNITVCFNYKDGTAEEYNLSSIWEEYWTDQYSEPWHLGGTYYIDVVTYSGYSVQVPVTIIENPIDYIELVNGTEYQYVENVNGYWNTRYNSETGEYEEFFRYYTSYPDDAQIRIVYKDGSSVIANVGNDVDGYYVGWNHNQYNQPWVVGSDNVSYITYMGKQVVLPITVAEDPVDYIELVNGTEYQYVENIDGYWDTRYNEETGEYEEFFRYYTSYPDDAQIRIVYKDGSSVITNVGNDVDGYYVGWSDNQYNQPWVLGSDNVSYITYMGKQVVLPITVIEDPVESIEVIGQIEIIENTNGYWEQRYNEETGEYEEFYYYSNYSFENITVRFNYKDGTIEDDDILYEYGTNQYSEPWLLGGTYYIDVMTYSGYPVQIPVTIIESPVDYIEIIGGTPKEYIEHASGYWGEYYNDETGEYETVFYYDTYVKDVSDVQVRIVYKDGSEATAYVYDYVDGYRVEWKNNQYNQPWVLGSNNVSYVTYMGKQVLLPITVIEDPVESVEVIGQIEIIENTNGYWDTRYNSETGAEEEYYYYSDYGFSGIQIQLNYKDGTVETYNLEDLERSWGDNQWEQPWVLGGIQYVYVTALGRDFDVPVVIIESPVDYLELINGTEYEYVENYDGYWYTRYNEETGEDEEFFWYDTSYPDDAQIRIIYKDGSEATAYVGDYIDGYAVGWSTDQYAQPWVLGSDNVTYVTYMGKQVVLPITVIENPVDYIELVNGTEEQYIEKIDGYWNTRYNEETGEYEEYFYYYAYDPYDAQIRIVYKDGSDVIVNVGEAVDGYYVGWNHNQYNQPWVVGSDNVSYITYLGKQVVLPITVVENPVDYIELVNGTEYQYVENVNGYWNTRYNEETGEEEEYFRYYASRYYHDDAQIRIVYKDGSEAMAYLGDYVGNYRVSWEYDQQAQPWVLGSDNVSYITYLGKQTVLPITVVENPVDYIELVTATQNTAIEGYGWDRGDYFFYRVPDISDAQIRIVYKDGTSVIANVGEYVNGYYVSYDYDQYETHWSIGSENYITLTYLGQEVEMPITVAENNIASVTLETSTELQFVEETDGEWYGDNFIYYGEGMYPDDAQIRVTYNDGSYDIVNVGDYLNGFEVYWDSYEAQYEQPWVVGAENVSYVNYLDYSVVLPITVVSALPEYTVGNVNGDDKINVIDYSILKRIVLGAYDKTNLKDQETVDLRCDMNGDGKINVVDYSMLKRYVLSH